MKDAQNIDDIEKEIQKNGQKVPRDLQDSIDFILSDTRLTPKEIRERLDKLWEKIDEDLEGKKIKEIILDLKNQNVELIQLLHFLYYEMKTGRSIQYSQNQTIDKATKHIKYNKLASNKFSDIDNKEEEWYQNRFFQSLIFIVIMGTAALLYLWYNDQQLLVSLAQSGLDYHNIWGQIKSVASVYIAIGKSAIKRWIPFL